jgi:hypothetical protein
MNNAPDVWQVTRIVRRNFKVDRTLPPTTVAYRHWKIEKVDVVPEPVSIVAMILAQCAYPGAAPANLFLPRSWQKKKRSAMTQLSDVRNTSVSRFSSGTSQ